MRRTLMLLTLAAVCVLPTSWTPVQAQNVEVRNFHGTVHPIRKIVRLTWWASEDSMVTSFTLDHSLDGTLFTLLDEVQPFLTGEEGHVYQYWHLESALGINHYQLTVNFADSTSRTIGPITVEVGRPPVYSYPTFPSSNNPFIRPLVGDGDDTWLEARITDLYGRPVAAVRNQNDFDLPDLPAGLYVLHARYESGWHATQFVITQSD